MGESVKKPTSMKKTSNASKGPTPKKVITKSKKEQKKATENKALKSRQSQSQEKVKKKVDPDKPKKPQVAYFLWMNEKGRESIKKANSSLTHKDVLRKCGEKWRGFTNSQKQPYEAKAKEDKVAYDKTKEEYKKRLADKPTKQNSQTKTPKKSLKKAK